MQVRLPEHREGMQTTTKTSSLKCRPEAGNVPPSTHIHGQWRSAPAGRFFCFAPTATFVEGFQ